MSRTRTAWLPRLCTGLFASLASAVAQAATCDANWPDWQRFAERWVQDDGRVLESSLQPDHSTSEGQAYALFFALVANDAPRFEKIWRWSRENLAGNAPQHQLPAWLWGKGEDGQWKVQDPNSASDADLWFAYALLEAARLWRKPEYQADAGRLLGRVKAQEMADLPGLGPMLLPGPVGFVQPDHLWRLNPSYLPLPLLRRLARFEPDGPWRAIAENTATLLVRGSAHGFVADWVGYRGTSEGSGLFVDDPFKGDVGSYDAIRVYLWAGITDDADPLLAKVLASLDGMARVTASSGVPPEKVAVQQGRGEGAGPFGFSAALVPYFHTARQPWLADLQYKRASAGLEAALAGERKADQPPVYYDYMLSLFGLGWAEKRYRFDAEGSVHTFWESPCSATTR
ncbi:cellulose synthase complex periplasmic endoglucanase BcsZ [Pseudomonas sp. Q1-7]|uniref:cellulose synthase complex periplasmic endoglucanase BcsZ n=1 Tax=Pseudomonas sp. Q1-7 TaxID=3020843 RepID=UPI0022FFEA64|nr:cellulose synthase complex periplasmic endoglucanase BcsZ [Pseudomonas sp. Q1-7]